MFLWQSIFYPMSCCMVYECWDWSTSISIIFYISFLISTTCLIYHYICEYLFARLIGNEWDELLFVREEYSTMSESNSYCVKNKVWLLVGVLVLLSMTDEGSLCSMCKYFNANIYAIIPVLQIIIGMTFSPNRLWYVIFMMVEMW